MDVNPDYVLKFLTDVEYPASREELVECAARQGGDAYVRAAVKALPEREYAGADDVSRAIGEVELGEAPYSADTTAQTPRPTAEG